MKIKNILLGLGLAALGIIFGLNALGLAHIDIFFDGWWTLFIIIPCAMGLFRGQERTGNLIGLAAGVALLLNAQGFLSFRLILKLIIPAILVITGVSIALKGIFGDRDARQFICDHKGDSGSGDYWATFSSQKLNFSGDRFRGAKLTAVFGGIDLDLTGTILDEDVLIDATAIFGGIDIHVPPQCRVKIQSSSIFGGISEENPHNGGENAITVYVDGTCVFGGVSIT